MKDSKYFDIQSYDKFIANNDYKGAAAYLRGFVWKDKAKQQVIDNSIKTFEHDGRITKAIFDKATPEQREALAFYNTFGKGGTLPNDKDKNGNIINSYSREYVKAINDLGGKYSTHLVIKFNPRIEKRHDMLFHTDWLAKDEDMQVDGFTLFSKKIGMDEKSLTNRGMIIERDKEGNVYMSFAKNNKYTPQIIQALHKTTRYNSIDNDDIDNINNKGYRFSILGYNENGTLNNKENNVTQHYMSYDGTKEGAKARLKVVDDYDIKQTNKLNTTYNISKLYNVINDAKTVSEDFAKQFEKKVLTKSIIANYLGQDDLNAKRLNNATNIKSIKDGYDMRLMGSGFSDMKVYSNIEQDDDGQVDDINKDTETLNEITSTKQRTAIHSLITGKIKDVVYSAAMVGDKIGTMITIPAEINDKGVMTKEARQIFVENLFRSEAEETFNVDSSLRAQKEYATMQKYEYDYDIDDSNAKGRKARIYGVDDTGAWYDNGVDNPYRIDRQEAVRLLNRQFIIDDGATNLKRSFTNPDGTPRNNTLFMQQLDNYTQQAVSELEPEAFRRVSEGYSRGGGTLDAQGQLDYDYYKRRQAELASFILSNIGFYENN